MGKELRGRCIFSLTKDIKKVGMLLDKFFYEAKCDSINKQFKIESFACVRLV